VPANAKYGQNGSNDDKTQAANTPEDIHELCVVFIHFLIFLAALRFAFQLLV
jgi:hypothetical protein